MLKHSSLLVKVTTLSVVSIWMLFSLLSWQVQALTLQTRSVRLSTATPSAVTVNNFAFTFPSTNAIGSIVFEYCDNTAIITVACNAPPGLNVINTNLITQTGNTGFSKHIPSTTTNKIVLTRTPSGVLAVPSTYVFDNITNPSDSNHTTYVRISTYITANGSGALTDNGSVAFSTVDPFAVNTLVPPFLRVCVGVTVAVDCSGASGNGIDLGVLTSQSPKTGTSQFAVGTNSVTGYVLSVIGTTMTSGNNSISAINPAASSQVGTSQFGINLRSNTIPVVGQEPQGTGTGTPQSNYDTTNIFKLNSGDTIAASSLPTEFNQMTVSYVVNVAPSQAAGIYTTTMTYLGTAQF